MNTTKFTLTKDHIKLITNFYVGYNDHCEFGAPEIDPKRPYGNSYVFGDMAEILGITPNNDDEFDDEQESYMCELHRELETALQIVLCCKTFKPGKFEGQSYMSRSWKRVK